MAYLLPLPYDMQFEIDMMVTSMKMKEVVHQLNEVCDKFWEQTKEQASHDFHTYWMWDQDEQDEITTEHIDDWAAMTYDKMDHDLYSSKWGTNDYRFFMCFNAIMTNHPEKASFTSLPLP